MNTSKTSILVRIKDNTLSYSFIVPMLILYGVFSLYQIGTVFYLSFFKGRLYSREITEFVGWENYIRLFKDPEILQVLKTTFTYIIIVVVLKIVIGLFLSLWLSKNTRTNKIARTLIFLPTATSGIATGLIWNTMYNPRYGLINNALNFLHLDFLTRSWLGNTDTAMFSIIVIDLWHWAGFILIIMVAGIQNIPQDIYDAGRIDGTNNFTENFYITIPLIKNVFLTITLFIITAAFKVYEYIFATTKGGPLNSTNLLAIHMYNTGIKDAQVTYGSAIAVFLFFLSLVFSGTFLILSKFGRAERE